MESLLKILNGDMGTLRTAVSTIERDLEKLHLENDRVNTEIRTERELHLTEKAGFEKVIFDLKHNLSEANDKLAICYSDINKFKEVLILKDGEIDRLRKELELRETHFAQQIAIQKDDFLTKQTKLESALLGVENEKKNLTDNIFLLRTENDRLVNLLFEKVVNFKNKITKWNEGMVTIKGDVYKTLEVLRTAMVSETEQIQQALKGFARERERLENESILNRQKISELETKNSLLHNEKEKLARLNMEKDSEIMQLITKSQDNERKMQEEFEEKIRLVEEDRRITLDRRERELIAKFNSEKTPLENMLKTLKQRVLELENQATYLSVELERVNHKAAELEAESENWKSKYERLEEERTTQIEEITMEFEGYKRAHFQASELEIKFNAERTSFQTEIMQLKQKIVDYENNIRNLKNENSSLQELSVERMREIENWRGKLQQLGDVSEIETLRQTLDRYKRQAMDERESNLKLDSEKKKLESTVKQLENEVQDKNLAIQRAYDLISELKQETGGTSKQADESRKEVLQLRGVINNLEAENLIKKEGIESLRRENDDLKSSIASLRSQINNNEFEVNNKSRELQAKIEELDVIKRKYEDALNSVSDASILGSKIKYSIKKETNSTMYTSSVLTESNIFK